MQMIFSYFWQIYNFYKFVVSKNSEIKVKMNDRFYGKDYCIGLQNR